MKIYFLIIIQRYIFILYIPIMRIKIFESWSKRFPSKITDDEWMKKKESWREGNSEPFTKSENDFIDKLFINNNKKIYESYFGESDFYISLYPTGDSDELIHIEIYKMTDLWFLLYDSENGHYLCDEFEEVEGYLGRETMLQF